MAVHLRLGLFIVRLGVLCQSFTSVRQSFNPSFFYQVKERVDRTRSNTSLQWLSLLSLSVFPSNQRQPTPTFKRNVSAKVPQTEVGIRDQAQSKRQKVITPLTTQLEYARNGHAVLRNFLEPGTVTKLRSELVKHGKEHELLAWKQKVAVAYKSRKPESQCATIGECQQELQKLNLPALPFLQFFNTWRHSSQVHTLIRKKLAKTAAVLLDVSSVRLYQDALFWKRQNDGPTPWHADARMAPFDTNAMITFWIPLQPCYSTGLIFASKSHADFSLPYWHERPSENRNNKSSPWLDLSHRYERVAHYMPLQLSDVTVHAGWTLHSADGGYEVGSDDGHRLALAVTFVDAAAAVRNDLSQSAAFDTEDAWSYQDWIRDVPTDKKRWNHPLVPIVWPPQRGKE